MPTQNQIERKRERARAVAEHGDKCFLCGSGPLQKRGMQLVEDADISPIPLPMCKACAESWDGSEAGVKRLARKMAKRYDRVVAILQAKYPKADIPAPKSFW